MTESAVVNCILRFPGRPPAILDRDITRFYGTTTGRLNQQVKRNRDLFPNDFLYRLNEEELETLVSQNVIARKSYLGGHIPFAFTQYGCNMLATILKTETANKRTIQIIRAFTAIEMMNSQIKQTSDSEHPITSKILQDIYSGLWIMKQAMVVSKEMQHYALSLDSIMKQAEGLIDGQP